MAKPAARLLVLLALIMAEGWVSAPAVLTTICKVQGNQASSPHLGNYVTVQGVVFADLDQTYLRGFFIQSTDCDSNPSTSDGIFVYTGESLELVNSGDLVRVSGWVNEYYGMTEISVSEENVLILSQGNSLPTAVELNPPFDNDASAGYYESLEGMFVSLPHGTVVGPTDLYDRSWLVRSDLGLQHIFWDTSPGTGVILCVDDAGLFEIEPEVKVGDQVAGLLGVLDYRFDFYCLEPLVEPEVVELAPEPAGSEFPVQPNGFDRTIATINLGNLFDTYDDPLTDDDVLSATQYSRKITKLAQAIHIGMGEPAFLAVQEAENEMALSDLVQNSIIEAQYGFLIEPGPDRRGLDIGLLYRLDLAEVHSYQVYQGCTALIDGLGPDGNLDVYHPANLIACDSNGDGLPDGNRLFSRPPLVVFASLCFADCLENSVPLNFIINHWKSKTEDSLQNQFTLPRRLQQADFVAGLTRQLGSAHPQIPLILLGDLNDHPGSEPLSRLLNLGLVDLNSAVPKDRRYSYIHQGVSQVLDHIFLGPSVSFVPTDVAFLHTNSDYPYSLMNDSNTMIRSSDHDALMINFSLSDYRTYLPYIHK